MAEFYFIKTAGGLVPSDEAASEWMAKKKQGAYIKANVTEPRNAQFHRKFFAMLNVAYQNHEWPEIDSNWGKAKTSYDMFRRYVTVKAGHYEPDMKPDGTIVVSPKSISFANMEEPEFQRLYSDVLNVILAEFLDGWTAGDMENAVNHMLSFA